MMLRFFRIIPYRNIPCLYHRVANEAISCKTYQSRGLHTDLSALKVTELKKLLIDKGLPVSGNKAMLLERLQTLQEMDAEKKACSTDETSVSMKDTTYGAAATDHIKMSETPQETDEQGVHNNMDEEAAVPAPLSAVQCQVPWNANESGARIKNNTFKKEDAPSEGPSVKAMVFIDGAWLYSSLYGERPTSSVSKRKGLGCQKFYQMQWNKLPILIARNLEKQLKKKQGRNRLVEVTRTAVFSSIKPRTNEDTVQREMFKTMQNSNFELHLLEKQSHEGTCADVACAAEMLHFAATPDAFDIAVLVTGDTALMPALVRTRDKGKQVAIVSMRSECHKALQNPSSKVQDFNIIWLDNFLSAASLLRFKQYAADVQTPLLMDNSSESLLQRAAWILEENGAKLSLRHLGRLLQNFPLDGKDYLAKIKEVTGGLSNFLRAHSDLFLLTKETGLFEDSVEFFVEFQQTLAAQGKKENLLVGTNEGIKEHLDDKGIQSCSDEEHTDEEQELSCSESENSDDEQMMTDSEHEEQNEENPDDDDRFRK